MRLFDRLGGPWGIGLLLWLVWGVGASAAGPDLTIVEIRFSNETPTEGDPVTITAVVKNIGTEPVTRNHDIDVWFFEDDPDAGSLQIQAKNTAAGLDVGEETFIRAKFRPRAGRFNIHAIVNPDPKETRVVEADRSNNEKTRLLVVAPKTFPDATPEQIQAAVDRAVEWLLDQQGDLVRKCPVDGTLNPTIVPLCIIDRASLAGLPIIKRPSPAWSPHDGPAATSLAVMTLLAAGLEPSHPALSKAIDYLLGLDWNGFDPYDLAVVILAFVATGEREKYADRVQFAVNRLIDKQLRVEKGADPRDDGGWGYGATADGAHMHYAIYALYTAKMWGIEVPQEAIDRAIRWVKSTQHSTGGWNYNLIESPWAEGPYGSMTVTGLMALKMMGVPITSPEFQRGMEWLTRYYTTTSNPGSFYWHYYYLLAVQRLMDTPPKQDKIGDHDWFREMANVFVATQYPDGRWEDADGESFAATSFGILFLTRYTPKPIAPDVAVVPDSLRISPSRPAEGTPVSVSFQLTSLGKPLAEPIVTVGLYDGDPAKGGRLLATQDVLFPEGRIDATATISWKAEGPGEHTITLVVDPDETIEEIDRGNNVASVALTIVPKGATAEERSPLRKLEDGVYAIGPPDKAVILDRKRGEVRIPGRIWAANRIIEYLATGPLGKVHETILVLDAEPIHIQTALLALGLEPENNLRVQGDPRVPRGDPVEIWVTWEYGGKREELRAEDLIYNVIEDHPMKRTPWVFTGSRFQGPAFMAEQTKSIIAAYRDPDAILNHPLPSGGEDGAYRANFAVLPPKQTPITLIIRPARTS